MTRTELLALLANPESSGVEFKEDAVRPEGLAKELVALANFEGGTVILGVEDGTNRVVGLTRADLEEWVMTVCRDKIRPELIPWFEIIDEVEPGKSVAVVRVEPGFAVHAVWHNNSRKYMIRVGSTSREASPEELERLFQRRSGFRAELRSVNGSSLDDLDLVRLDDYFSRVRGQEAPAAEDQSGWERLLVNTELMMETQAAPAPSLAGLAMFGHDPDRFLPHLGIDAAAFPGTEKDYTVLERAHLKGPMVGLGPPTDMADGGVVERALQFVERNAPAEATLIGGQRVERPPYPREAVREAVVNALVHRDFLLSGSDIELSIYADRLEVISPGRLPNGITPDAMRDGARAARNQIIRETMRDYGYVEAMGLGVSRKIVAGMQAHNGTEPDLVEEGERFIVRLHR